MSPADVSRGTKGGWVPGSTEHYTTWGAYSVCCALTPEGEFFMPFLKGKVIGPRFTHQDQAQAFCESHAAREESWEARD